MTVTVVANSQRLTYEKSFPVLTLHARRGLTTSFRAGGPAASGAPSMVSISSPNTARLLPPENYLLLDQPVFSSFSTTSTSNSNANYEKNEPDHPDAEPLKNEPTIADYQPAGTATVTFVENDEGILKNDDQQAQDEDGRTLPHPRSHYTIPIVVKMPDMSTEDDLHNTIERWYKQPGDVVQRNDVLCDIGTPDFTFGMVTDDEDDCLMGDVHVEEGSMVADDTPICTLLHYDPAAGADDDDAAAEDGNVKEEKEPKES